MNSQLIIDIVYFFVHYIFQIFLFHFYYSLFITPKDNKNKILAFIIFPAANVILSYIGIAAGNDSIIHFLAIMIFTMLPSVICFKESKRQCFFAAVILYVALIGVDCLYSSVIMETIGYFPTKLETKTWASVAMSVGYIILLSITVLAISFIWRKKLKKIQIKSIGLFMLFPLGQLLFLAACGAPTMTGDYQIFSNSFVVLAFIIAIVSDIAMFHAMKESSKMEEMKLRMLEMEHSLEMQYQYYDNLMKKQEEIREYRHDINNLVSTVEALVEKNISLPEGTAMVEELKARTQNTVIPLYCSNPIVNTVLWQKQKEANAQGTEFSVNIDSNEDFPIDRIEACSLFANLLDNAIRETAGLENSFIRVSSSRKIGLLFIDISNTCKENKIITSNKPNSTKKRRKPRPWY